MWAPINPKSDIKQAIKSVLFDELKSAAKVLSLSQGLDKERFKEARKSLKRVRAVLSLIKESISKKTFKEEENTVKELSRTFRDVRNACVIDEALLKLLASNSSKIDSREAKEIKAVLTAHIQHSINTTFKDNDKLRAALGELQAALERIPNIEISHKLPKSIETGLRDSYCEAFEDFQVCEDANSSNDWISWRQSVNFLTITLDIFRLFLSKDFLQWNESLRELSNLLGEHQDLLFLEDEAKEVKKLFENRRALRVLMELSEERRKDLRKQAKKEAAKLFVKTPKDFVKILYTKSDSLKEFSQ